MSNYLPFPISTKTTLKNFVTNPLSIVNGWVVQGISIYSDILEISLNGISNFDRIWAAYIEEREEFASYIPYNVTNDNENLIILQGTILYLPKDQLNKAISLISGSNQVIIQPARTYYLSSVLEGLMKNTKYVPKFLNTKDKLKFDYPQISVYLWSKTLWKGAGLVNSLVNLTPFISQLSTTKGLNSGGWQVNLAPIEGKFIEGVWQIDKNRVNLEGSSYIASSEMNSDSKESLYFPNIISENDLIFISYEPLQIEEIFEKTRYDMFNPIWVDNIAKGYYDMIGMVGSCEINRGYANADIQISVRGKDLTKLLSDDSIYFYPESFIQTGLFANGLDSHGLARIENRLIGFISDYYKTIDVSIKFIINALSSMEVCPDELFSSYASSGENGADERSTHFNILPGDKDTVQSKGIWQIVKFIMDETIKDRHIIDSSIGNQNGSILNHLSKLIQEPFIEMITDTYKNQFFITVRPKPFNKDAFLSLAKFGEEHFTISKDLVYSDFLTFNEDDIYSWYRLEPTGLIAGAGSTVAWAYLKAVRFDHYTKIWGERPLEISSNYFRFDSEESTDLQTNKFIEQALYDLQFLVDIYQYSPFTRKGTLNIVGDRRYKVGTIVYYEKTDEYFYIEGVNQRYIKGRDTIDRVTTLTVSHGMVKSYINKYFEIIDTSLKEEDFRRVKQEGNFDWVVKLLSTWRVNEDVFNFFLKRLQFRNKPQPTIEIGPLTTNAITI